MWHGWPILWSHAVYSIKSEFWEVDGCKKYFPTLYDCTNCFSSTPTSIPGLNLTDVSHLLIFFQWCAGSGSVSYLNEDGQSRTFTHPPIKINSSNNESPFKNLDGIWTNRGWMHGLVVRGLLNVETTADIGFPFVAVWANMANIFTVLTCSSFDPILHFNYLLEIIFQVLFLSQFVLQNKYNSTHHIHR